MKPNQFRNAGLKYLLVTPALLCLFLMIPKGQIMAAWTEPSSAPPGGNVAAPINTSGTSQTKLGSLSIDGDFLSISSGNIYLPSNDRGIFWFNAADATKPHINFSGSKLYISSGESGTGTELQGQVKIVNAGGNTGDLTVSSLSNCSGANTIKTDAAGKLVCDVDGGGGGGGGVVVMVNVMATMAVVRVVLGAELICPAISNCWEVARIVRLA
jgi:hypothetical protein